MEYPFAANLNIDDFAIAKVLQRNSKNFVAQISSGPDEDEDHEVRFLKRSLGFFFLEVFLFRLLQTLWMLFVFCQTLCP